MVNAFQNVITITRGDDAHITIDIADILGNEYIPQDGDVVTMYVKKPVDGASLEAQSVLFSKVFDENSSATIDSTDTKNLEAGTYKYSVKLDKADGRTATIISPTDFVVEEGIA